MFNEEKAKGIRLGGLTKVFAGRRSREVIAVNNVSLEVKPGELLTLLGPSGCGKTTVLRMISGLEKPTAGEIFIGDKLVNAIPPNLRNVGLVFQSYALFPHLSVFENVAYSLRIKRKKKKEIEEEVKSALTLVGLDGYQQRMPGQLSGGEQQRVALARALIPKPQVLLFDEPLSNLDAKLRGQVRGEIRKIQKTLGITSVYVTHDQSEAMSLSDRIAVMNKGKIEQVDEPQKIYKSPVSPFVADFIGRANLVSSKVKEIRGNNLVVAFYGNDISVRFLSENFEIGEAFQILIRPEAIKLSSEGDGDINGIIRHVDYQGPGIEYIVEVEETQFLVNEQLLVKGSILKEGMKVGLKFNTESFHALKT